MKGRGCKQICKYVCNVTVSIFLVPFLLLIFALFHYIFFYILKFNGGGWVGLGWLTYSLDAPTYVLYTDAVSADIGLG